MMSSSSPISNTFWKIWALYSLSLISLAGLTTPISLRADTENLESKTKPLFSIQLPLVLIAHQNSAKTVPY
jgi:hypothetical protein